MPDGLAFVIGWTDSYNQFYSDVCAVAKSQTCPLWMGRMCVFLVPISATITVRVCVCVCVCLCVCVLVYCYSTLFPRLYVESPQRASQQQHETRVLWSTYPMTCALYLTSMLYSYCQRQRSLQSSKLFSTHVIWTTQICTQSTKVVL